MSKKTEVINDLLLTNEEILEALSDGFQDRVYLSDRRIAQAQLDKIFNDPRIFIKGSLLY